MFLRELSFSCLRLFDRLHLTPATGINLFFGVNGSGKTSLLEGLYFLSRVRSFRSHRLAEIIHHGSERLCLSATVEEAGGISTLSVEKGRSFTRIGANGDASGLVSEQAQRLPVLIWMPESASLFTGSPSVRRRWLDWSLFHVERGFLPLWKRYCRTLRHRNAVLRGAPGEQSLDSWEKSLCDDARAIDSLRAGYLEALQTHWREGMENLGLEADIVYRRGWKANSPLAEQLRQQREADRQRGHTCAGPHRADVLFRESGLSVSSRLSGGQMKRYGVGLVLGQVLCMSQQTGRTPLVLMDDVDADLDSEGLRCVLEALCRVPAQHFLTTLNSRLVEQLPTPGPEQPLAVFHMKRGRVEVVQCRP